MKLKHTLALGALCASLPAFGQIIPKDAAVPVQVTKPKGAFAKKLDGAVMPTGKGWKAVTDGQKRLQIMVPESWKVDAAPDGEIILSARPPGNEKEQKVVLMVVLGVPSDSDPLEVTEEFAQEYAGDLADLPALKKAEFSLTDGGFVVARGLKFALAGGTMVSGKKQKETFQQEQLLYVAEDRFVTIQFSAPAGEFSRYADDVAKIFASYQNIGAPKPDDS
jgi:hypothetical protein